MSPTQVEGAKAGLVRSGGTTTPKQLTIAPAEASEVMREQLEYLIEHARHGLCGCAQCQQYLRARSVLLEIFSEDSGLLRNFSQ